MGGEQIQPSKLGRLYVRLPKSISLGVVVNGVYASVSQGPSLESQRRQPRKQPRARGIEDLRRAANSQVAAA